MHHRRIVSQMLSDTRCSDPRDCLELLHTEDDLIGDESVAGVVGYPRQPDPSDCEENQ